MYELWIPFNRKWNTQIQYVTRIYRTNRRELISRSKDDTPLGQKESNLHITFMEGCNHKLYDFVFVSYNDKIYWLIVENKNKYFLCNKI